MALAPRLLHQAGFAARVVEFERFFYAGENTGDQGDVLFGLLGTEQAKANCVSRLNRMVDEAEAGRGHQAAGGLMQITGLGVSLMTLAPQ